MRKREIYIPKPFIAGLTLIVVGGILLSSSNYVRALVGIGQTRSNGAAGGSHAVRQPAANVAPGNLLAHYPFDGDTKDAAATSGNNLTDNNTVTQASTKTNAAQFTSANTERLEITDNAALSAGVGTSFEIGLWVNFASLGSTDGILGKGSTDPNSEYRLLYVSAQSALRFDVLKADNSGSSSVAATTFGIPATTTWIFVNIWHDAATDQIGIRINDRAQNTASYAFDVFDGTGPFWLGERPGAVYLNGALDAVGFWKRTLSTSERSKLYNGGSGMTYQQVQAANMTTSLQAYWDLNETSGNRADSAGSNTLTDINTVTSQVGPTGIATGNAAQFTAASSEYLSKTDNADLSMGDINFTVAAWVYPDNVTGTVTIASKYAATGASTSEYLLRRTGTTFTFLVSGGSTTGNVVSSVTVSANQWYYVMAWHDSVTNKINIQVNNGAVTSDDHTAGSNDSNTDFNVGRRGNGSEYFDGRIDELGIWKRLLTTDERTSLYNGGVGRMYRDLPANLTSNLVSYWDLEEASGTRNDAHFHGQNHGTIAGGVAPSTTAKFGQSYSFDGVGGSRITIPSTNLGTVHTVSFWIYYTDAGDGVIIGNTNNAGYGAYVDSSNASTGKIYYSTGSSNNVSVNHNGLAGPAWAYMTIVRNGTSVDFYKNGVQLSTTQTLGANTALTVGAIGDYSNGGFPTAMNLDDLRIYNTNLSIAQIADLYGGSKAPACDQSCVGWWKMDETDGGQTVTDSSGLANTGVRGTTGSVETTDPAQNATSIYNGAYAFDGINDTVVVNDANSLDLTNQITVSAWIRPTVSVSGTRRFVDKGYNTSFAFNGPNSGSNGISVWINNGSRAATASDVYQVGVWSHVAFTYNKDAGSDQVKIYVNGALAGTGTYSSAIGVDANPVSIGGTSTGSSTLAGQIDDVRMYSRALAPYEIAEQYTAGR